MGKKWKYKGFTTRPDSWQWKQKLKELHQRYKKVQTRTGKRYGRKSREVYVRLPK